MRKILHWTLALAVAALAWGATPAKKKGSAKVPAKSGSKTAGSKSGSRSAAARSGSKNSSKAATKAQTWRNRQTVPAPERYREIQEALVAKGYLSPESAKGTWDQASVDALKRFQTEQNIDSTGKINSLSLIALGLGPKHGTPPPSEPVPADAKQ
jgi:hypothetical protein